MTREIRSSNWSVSIFSCVLHFVRAEAAEHGAWLKHCDSLHSGPCRSSSSSSCTGPTWSAFPAALCRHSRMERSMSIYVCVCVGFRRHPPLLEEVLWCRRSLLYVRTLNLRKDTTTSPGNLVAGRRGGAPSCWSGTWELDMTGADTCVHAVTSKGSLSVPFSF